MDNVSGDHCGDGYITFGISGMVNLGKIDNEKGDDIRVVIDKADHSQVSICEINSYT